MNRGPGQEYLETFSKYFQDNPEIQQITTFLFATMVAWTR